MAAAAARGELCLTILHAARTIAGVTSWGELASAVNEGV